jgi:hypothetical protein
MEKNKKNKKSFFFKPFHNGFYNLQNSYILHYFSKCIIWTLPNIDVRITYPWKNLKSIALFNIFLLIHLRWKLQLKQGLKLFKRTQRDINNTSNLFLDFFIRLTWHHSNYSYIPIHYNHEIINVIKIQNSPL